GSSPGFVATAPGCATLNVSREVSGLEVCRRPVVGTDVGGVVPCVGPTVATVDQVNADEVVHGVFERVQDSPLMRREAREQVARYRGLRGNEPGIDALAKGSGPPTLDGCRFVVGNSVYENGQNLRELEGSIDEQGLRTHRQTVRSASGLRGRPERPGL